MTRTSRRVGKARSPGGAEAEPGTGPPRVRCAHPGYIRRMTTRIEIEQALRRLAPRIPKHEFAAVVDHALDSRGLRGATPETAAWLSLVAIVRHALTDYDDLLAEGYD